MKFHPRIALIIFGMCILGTCGFAEDVPVTITDPLVQDSPPTYLTTQPTIDLAGSAGVRTICIGAAVESADLSYWPSPTPTTIYIDMTTAAEKAAVVSADLSLGIGEDGTVYVNSVGIDYVSADTDTELVDKINAVVAQTGVKASSAAGVITLETLAYGSAASVTVTSATVAFLGAVTSATDAGVDAWAEVTTDGWTGHVTDSSWRAGSGLTIKDSCGNTIVLTEQAGTVVADWGPQISVEIDEVALVTWSNGATGGSGSCIGTNQWSVTGISLAPGENLITVTAHDPGDGTGVDDLTVIYYVPAESPGAVKQMADGSHISLAGQIVSAGTSELGDCFYIESPDRTSGIKVTGASAERDTIVQVEGVMATVNGEREIQAEYVTTTASGSVSALGMNNATVGGGACGYQGAVGMESAGLNNIGLLVRTCGLVVEIDAGEHWFKIDDGSEVNLKCVVPEGLAVPLVGSYAAVTGASSCEQVGDELHRLIRVRTGDDVQELAP